MIIYVFIVYVCTQQLLKTATATPTPNTKYIIHHYIFVVDTVLYVNTVCMCLFCVCVFRLLVLQRQQQQQQ